MKISLLDITGKIDDDTPLIVLDEICNSHDLCFFEQDNIVPLIINFPFVCSEDYINAAKLINKSAIWDDVSLTNSFEFMINFLENPFYTTDNTSFGLSSLNNPYCYNSSMCYRLLREKNLVINKYCTFQELSNAVLIAYRSSTSGRTILYSAICEMSSEELSDMYIHGLNKKVRVDEPYDFGSSSESSNESLNENLRHVDENGILNHSTYEEMKYLTDLYQNESYVMGRLNPITISEAICLAAINYQIDISAASDPIDEYRILRINPKNYIPKDTNLREILKINPLMLNLNYFFNPHLPVEVYSEISLRAMVLFEGYREEDLILENAYSLLQSACFTETFHTGYFSNAKNKVTLEYEDVSELLLLNVIVYYGNYKGELYAFRISELDKVFRKERCYKNPLNGHIFDDLAIRKLKNICNTLYSYDSDSSFSERRTLASTIEFTDIYNAENMKQLRELYEIYEDNEDIKTDVVKAINLLMELGMYMRGWEGEGEYPIEICIVRNQANTDVFVTNAIHNFEKACENLENVGTLLLNLPLLKHVRGRFIPSNNANEGITIGERINIVKGGENNDIIYSCIRLTSNWICATAYRIMQVLKLTPTFDIKKLREIS